MKTEEKQKEKNFKDNKRKTEKIYKRTKRTFYLKRNKKEKEKKLKEKEQNLKYFFLKRVKTENLDWNQIFAIYIYPPKDSNPGYKGPLQIYKKKKGNPTLMWQKIIQTLHEEIHQWLINTRKGAYHH